MQRLTVKTSTIFISVGSRTQVYRSVDDVPPKLRRKLQETTTGINAATILIADRKGREEIIKALRGGSSSLRSKSSSAAATRKVTPRLDWRTCSELLLAGAAGLLLWLAFTYR